MCSLNNFSIVMRRPHWTLALKYCLDQPHLITLGLHRRRLPSFPFVLLFPSVYEGMPLVLVEAASAGIRAVCSDAITPEATDVLPDSFTRLSLDLPPKEWAIAVVDAIKKGPIPREYSYKQVKESHFSVDYSLRGLMSIYGCNVKG